MAVHKLQPGSLHQKYAKPVARQMNAFQKRERITQFINACKKIGVRESDVFMVEDLFMKNSLKQVVITLENLSSTASRKKLQQPFSIGLSYSKKNKRNFTAQQLRTAKNIVPKMNQGSTNVNSGPGLDSHGIILQGSHK
jgi:hypothetical protein